MTANLKNNQLIAIPTNMEKVIQDILLLDKDFKYSTMITSSNYKLENEYNGYEENELDDIDYLLY